MISALAIATLGTQILAPWSGSPVFRDEFDRGLDPKKWQAIDQTRTGGQSKWDPSMIEVKNGKLIIKILRMPDGLPRYISGAIRSRKDYDPKQTMYEKKFGYFEIQATLPKNLKMDTWFAFWMMTGDIRDGQDDSTKGTEIDIMESFFAHRGEIGHNLHWGGYGAGHNSYGTGVNAPQVTDGKPHTYGMLWTPTEYIFYIDRKETWRTDMIGVGTKPTAKSKGVSQVPGYLKLSVEAATWAGPTNDWDMGGISEDQVEVEYVRVWEYRKPR